MIITLDKLKLLLKIDNDSIDDVLTHYINTAGLLIKHYCNQPVDKQEGCEFIVSGNGKDSLNLYYTVPITVSKIEARADRGTAWAEIPDTDYSLEKINGSVWNVYYPGCFSTGDLNYKITADIGYTSDTAPDDVQQIAVEIVSEMHDKSVYGKSRLGVSVQQSGFQGSTTQTTYVELSQQHKERLKPYRVRVA